MKWIGFKYAFQELRFLSSGADWKILWKFKIPLFLYKLFLKRIVDLQVPLELQLEPTNYCSLRCLCCSVERMTRKKGFLDFELFKKIIADASRAGVRKVHLYLHGEPFLHPQLIEMIGYLKSHPLSVCLSTNGMLLNEKKAEALLRSGVSSADSIVFSILGNSKKVHEQVMPGVVHEQVLNNVFNFLALRKKLRLNGPIVETVFYCMDENVHEKQEFFNTWHTIVDRVRIVDKISTSFADYQLNRRSIPARSKACDLLFERLTVYWNGDVSLCAQDIDGQFVFGSLQEKSIKDMWNCDELIRIRSLQRKRNFSQLRQCATCDW